MKHVYPPRHPAWLDTKGDRGPPTAAGPAPEPARGQPAAGGGTVTGQAGPGDVRKPDDRDVGTDRATAKR